MVKTWFIILLCTLIVGGCKRTSHQVSGTGEIERYLRARYEENRDNFRTITLISKNGVPHPTVSNSYDIHFRYDEDNLYAKNNAVFSNCMEIILYDEHWRFNGFLYDYYRWRELVEKDMRERFGGTAVIVQTASKISKNSEDIIYFYVQRKSLQTGFPLSLFFSYQNRSDEMQELNAYSDYRFFIRSFTLADNIFIPPKDILLEKLRARQPLVITVNGRNAKNPDASMGVICHLEDLR